MLKNSAILKGSFWAIRMIFGSPNWGLKSGLFTQK